MLQVPARSLWLCQSTTTSVVCNASIHPVSSRRGMVWRERKLRGAPSWSGMHNLQKDYAKLEESLRHPSKSPGYVSILQDKEAYPYAPDPPEDLPGAEGPLLMRNGFVRELLLNCASKQNVFDEEFTTAAQGQLHKWGRSDEIHLICVSTKFPDLGNPFYEPEPAFSAGEDFVGLYEQRRNEPALIKNLQDGYRLIGTVANMRKPTLMVVNGATSGAGSSMAFFGNMSAVEETSVAAFPACSLGLAPGYGATYFLNRYTTPAFGMMLALTGKRLKYWDLIHCGLATNALHFTSIPYLAKTMADGQGERGLGMLMTGINNYEPEIYGPYTLGPYVDLIERCFGGKDSVEEICEALKEESLHFAHYLLRKILDNSAVAVQVAFRLMKDAERRELDIDYLCEQELAADEHAFVDTLGLSSGSANRRPYEGDWTPTHPLAEGQEDIFFNSATAFAESQQKAQQQASSSPSSAARGASTPTVDGLLASLGNLSSRSASAAAAAGAASSSSSASSASASSLIDDDKVFDDGEETDLEDLLAEENEEQDHQEEEEDVAQYFPEEKESDNHLSSLPQVQEEARAAGARLAAMPSAQLKQELERLLLSNEGPLGRLADNEPTEEAEEDWRAEMERLTRNAEGAIADGLFDRAEQGQQLSKDRLFMADDEVLRLQVEEEAETLRREQNAERRQSPEEEALRQAAAAEPVCHTEYHDANPEKMFTRGGNTVPVTEEEEDGEQAADEDMPNPLDSSMFEVKVTRVRQALLPERGAHLLGLQKSFEAEYRANLRLLQGPEFAEAVEKRILGSNGKPVWNIKHLKDVPQRLVDDIVAPFRDSNDELPNMNPYSHKGANLRSHLRDFYKMRHITGPAERNLMFYAERHMFGGKLRG